MAISLQRCTRSLNLSAYRLSRIASLLANDAAPARPASANSFCSKCYTRPSQTRRPFSTATEYKPYALESAPPPPRNANIPDISIVGSQPQINGTRLLQLPEQQEHEEASIASPPRREENSSVSLRESESQVSTAVKDPPATLATKSGKRPSKLRARKAAMSLTPSATVQLRALLDQPEPKLIRVGVKNRGCSGLAYHLEYVDQQGAFDEAVEQDGVKVLVDSKALFSIIGSEMDWVEDKLEQRFVFRNPNIKEQCGCGESFMV